MRQLKINQQITRRSEGSVNAYFNDNYEEAKLHTIGTKREKINPKSVTEASAVETSIESITSTEENGEEAAVTYVLSADTSEGTQTISQTSYLVRQDGDWLICYISETEYGPDIASNFDNIDDGDPVDKVISLTESLFNDDTDEFWKNVSEEYDIFSRSTYL